MHSKNTFRHLLMTSAIALSFFSMHEAWASKRAAENGIEEDGKGMKRLFSEKMWKAKNQDDEAYALQMQQEEFEWLQMEKKVQDIGLDEDSMFIEEKHIPNFDDEMDVQEPILPQNNNNNNNNNNNYPLPVGYNPMLYHQPSPQPIQYHSPVVWGNPYLTNTQNHFGYAPQMPQVPMQNFPPFRSRMSFDQEQLLNGILGVEKNGILGVKEISQRPQVYIDSLQDDLKVAKGKRYNRKCNSEDISLYLQTTDHKHIFLKFDMKKMLPKGDIDLIDEMAATIRKNGTHKGVATRKLQEFLGKLSQTLLKQNAAELEAPLRELIRETIDQYQNKKEPLKDLIKYLEDNRSEVKTPITLDSPILKCISGDNLPEFIVEDDPEYDQNILHKYKFLRDEKGKHKEKAAIDALALKECKKKIYEDLYKLFLFKTMYCDAMNDEIIYDIKHLLFVGYKILPLGYDFKFQWVPMFQSHKSETLPNMIELGCDSKYKFCQKDVVFPTLVTLPHRIEPVHQFPYGELLTSLDMSSRNFIRVTNEWVRKLRNLRSLRLGNNFRITNEGISGLTQLTYLDVSHDNLITNEGIQALTNLTCLNLGCNKKITLTGIRRLPKLTGLGLSYNPMIKDVDLPKLTGLTNLNLSNNDKIKDSGLQKLTKLARLTLTNSHRITATGIQNCIHLTSLDLNNCNSFTDAVIQKFTKLTSLNLSRFNPITDDGMSWLVNLQELGLRGNDRITIRGIPNPWNLTSLDLSLNTTITDNDLQNFINLTRLDLSYNQLITDNGIQGLTKLTSLGLLGNRHITDNVLAQLGLVKTAGGDAIK